MDNNSSDVLSAGDPLYGPDFDGSGFDADEEVLLLQMTETGNGADSPSLQALLDDQPDFACPLPQRQQSPLFIERPRSPGTETEVFSWAKPAHKPFLLQPILRRSSSNTNQDKPHRDGNTMVNSPVEGQCGQDQTAVNSNTGKAERPTSPEKVDSPSESPEQREDQNQQDSFSTTLNTDARPGSRASVDGHIEQALPPQLALRYNEQQAWHGAAIHDTESLAFSGAIHAPPDELRNNERTLDVMELPGPPDSGQERACEPQPDSNRWKVTKRRHNDKKKTAKRVSYAPSDIGMEVPEEALFRQLIGRLRAREESEAVASNMQKEMEANLANLREENAILKEDLELLSSKLQKRTAEARDYKSQTDSWKPKLAKVKLFLNEIETGYQNLRGEAIHFKATRKTLDKERKEIAESIEDVKARMSQITEASGERRSCLSDAESLIASLGQELKHTRERVQYSQNQLVDEKKRTRLLELYIQNCSRAQDRKLDLMKTNQMEVMKKLESAFEATNKNYESSRTIISDGFDRKFHDFLTQVGAATKSLSDGKMDVQRCRETICVFESRMDATIRQLEAGTENHTKNAEGFIQNLEEQIKKFKDSVSDGSTLIEQLSSSNDRCRDLQTLLEETVPTFNNLDRCIDGLQEKEVDLGQRMQSLETKLSEVRLPERFKDDYVHISEKLRLENEIKQLTSTLKSTEEKLDAQKTNNTQKQEQLRELTARAQAAESNATKLESNSQKQADAMVLEKQRLESEIQRLKTEAESAEERLKVQQLDSAQKQDEIRELAARAHQAETSVASLETHAANLEQKIEETRQSAQENIENAVTNSKYQCQADFERQLQEQLTEKAKFEADKQRVKVQLDELQRKLMEAENSAREQRKDLEILLVERQQRIQDLEASRVDQASSIARQATEIEQMKAREATLAAQHTALLGKFDEVHGRLNGFQVDLLKTIGENHLSRKTQEDYFSTIQAELRKKREDCLALQDSLSSLQDQLVRKVQECQGLQDSLNATEDELAATKNECKELQGSLSSLRSKVGENEEARQALQTTLSTIESRLTKKEEECQAVSKELEDANNARSSLESGKSKAKAEMFALLKRVQVSELEVKKITETLHRLNVAQPGQSLTESLEQLESALQAATATGLASDGQGLVQVRTPEISVRGRNTRVLNESYDSGEADMQTGADGRKEPINYFDESSPSKQAGTIVPFSSILEGLSPAHFSVNDNEPFDLSCVLTQTPRKASTSQEPTIPARPEKNNLLDRSAGGAERQEVNGSSKIERVVNTLQTTSTCTQERPHQSAPVERGLTKPQTLPTTRKVSFVTQRSTAETDNLQVPDSQEKSVQRNTLEPLLDEAHPTRTNRWTYSKRQRETSTKQQETTPVEKVSSQNEDQQMHSKKAKTASTASVVDQTKTPSELCGRRKSPARLASGSSRASSSALLPGQSGATGGRRRSGQRARGDKYNARFSQGA